MSNTIEVVSVEDPALDRSRMNVRKYAETRDPGLIVELPGGARAVRWTVRDLTKGESDTCDDRGVQSPITKLNFSLQYALLKIDTGAAAIVPTLSVPDRETGGTKLIWSDEQIAELQRKFGKTVLREIAMIILQRDDRVGEAFGGGSVSYTLLQSSLDALARIERRPAA